MTTPQCVVMVVNGETLIQGLIKDALVLLGYDIIAADSGDAAFLIVASRVAIDVIVNDSVMPGETNRFYPIERANASQPGIHIIAMSGYVAKQGDKITLANKFLQKPFTIPALERTPQSLTLQNSLSRAAFGSGSNSFDVSQPHWGTDILR